MVSSLDEAEQRWSQRSLGANGLPKWEAEGQNVSDGVHSWGQELSASLRRIGAVPGEKYLQKYVTRTVDAAAAGRYREGVTEAARERRWRSQFESAIAK